MVEEKPEEMAEQFQLYQQQLQSILIQKESLKLQAMEIDRALEELEKTGEKTAYKITGQIMISKPIEELKKDLNENKETVEIRIKGLEKTEERMISKLKELQEKLKDVIKE